MATSTPIGFLDNILPRIVNLARTDFQGRISPVFTEMTETDEGVVRDMGENCTVKIKMIEGLAGAMRNVPAVGPATLDTALTGGMPIWSGLETFPLHNQVANFGHVDATITLVKGLAIYTLPVHYYRAQVIPDAVIDAVTLTATLFAKMLMMHDAASWFACDPDTKAIYKVLNTSCLSGNGGQTITFDFSDASLISGRLGTFQKGSVVQGWDASATPDVTLANSADGIVTNVDHASKTMTIYFPAGNVTFDTNDYITSSGSTVNVGPSGPMSWIKNSGSIFGVALADHPDLKSLIYAANSVLDGMLLNRVMSAFDDMTGGDCDLDRIITTNGVRSAFLNSLDGLRRYHIDGAPMKVAEGWEAIDFSYGGRQFQMATDRHMPVAEVWIMKTRGNQKRYVPPAIRDAITGKLLPGGVEFLGKLFGSTGERLPYNSPTTGALSTYTQTPVQWVREHATDDPRSIRVTGVYEDAL